MEKNSPLKGLSRQDQCCADQVQHLAKIGGVSVTDGQIQSIVETRRKENQELAQSGFLSHKSLSDQALIDRQLEPGQKATFRAHFKAVSDFE